VPIRRWTPWAYTGGLVLLTVASAIWSASTSPQPPRHRALAALPPPAVTTTTTTAVLPSLSGSLTISATDLHVGQQVTVSGSGCPVGHWGTAVLQEGTNGPLIFDTSGLDDEEQFFTSATGDEAGGIVGADGRWTMTALVPMVDPGAATLTGWCIPQQGDDGESIEFYYPDYQQVMVSTPYQLVVEPATTVTAGTTLMVNLVGGSCPGVSGAQLNLYSGSGIEVAFEADDTVPGWMYELTVPAGLSAGLYQLEADCVYDPGQVQGSYAPVIITVQ